MNYYLTFTLFVEPYHCINKNYTIVRAELLLYLSYFHLHGKSLGPETPGLKSGPE